MSEKKHIARATGVMGAATFLSRIAGLVRDVLIASLFGAGFGTDAFFMAFTIPNLLRRFFAEGSLTAAFVPTFSDVYLNKGKEEANRLFGKCLALLLVVMIVVTLIGVLGSPYIVKGIAFGFGSVEGKLGVTDFLNRIMFPYILFASILALVTGVLNVTGHYFVPALSTVFLNLSMILCGWLLAPLFDIPITALAIGVLLGGFIQLIIQFPVIKKQGVRLSLDFDLKDSALRRIAMLMLPGIAGVAIYQINVIVTRLLASFLPQGSVSYLYYGQRLFEFPQGIFIVALAQAVLPAMSRQIAEGNEEGLKDSLRFSMSLILLVTLPATVGLILCATPVYSLFFMSGEFSYSDVEQAALALMAYAPGLFFLGISRVIVSAFYAMKDTSTPVWISFWTLLANVVFGLLLMGPFGHVGLAAALTLSSVVNCLFLLWKFRKNIGSLGLKQFFSRLLRLVPGVAFMAIAVQFVLSFGPWAIPGHYLVKFFLLAIAVTGGVGIYTLSCFVFKVPEARDAYILFRKKLSRG